MIRAVIACGRDWTPGDPCRQAHPVGAVESFEHAREIAAAAGWSTVVEGATVVDRCPACTRRELEAPRPRPISRDRAGRPMPGIVVNVYPAPRPGTLFDELLDYRHTRAARIGRDR